MPQVQPILYKLSTLSYTCIFKFKQYLPCIECV